MGGELSREIAATRMLLVAAREKNLPIAFTAVGFDSSGRDGATWLRKMPGLAVLVENSPWCEIDERVKPLGRRTPMDQTRFFSIFRDADYSVSNCCSG